MIRTVPRDESWADTREIVWSSGASTMLTNSCGPSTAH